MRSAPASSARRTAGGPSTASASAALAEPEDLLDLGNSGTAARLLLGMLATHPITAFVTGDASLRRRPMGRVVDPLSRFGARFVTREGGRLPLAVSGAADPMPDHLSPAGALGPGQIRGPARRAQHAGGDHGDRAAADARPHRAHAAPFRRARSSTEAAEGGGKRITVEGYPELDGGADRRAGRPVLGGLSAGRGADRAGLRGHHRRGRHQPAAHRPSRVPARDGRRHRSAQPSARRAASRSPIIRARAGTPDRRRHPRRAGAADDRRVPDPRRRRRLRPRAHGDARPRRAARQGKRPPRGDRRRALPAAACRSRSRATI